MAGVCAEPSARELTEPARSADRAWAPYLALMALATAGYVLAGLWGPAWLNSGLVFNLIGGLSVAGLIAGAKINSPRRRLPWYLLAIGQAMFVASDVLAYNYERLFGSALTFPSVADSFHLAFYPFLVGGMLLLIHERDEDRGRSALIDALTITLALATLLWVYLISPYANNGAMSELGRLASIGYPAMDILVVGVLARMAAGCHRREPAFNFMLCAIGALLVERRDLRLAAARRPVPPGAGDDGRLGGVLHAARHGGDAPVDATALRARAANRRHAHARASDAVGLREPHGPRRHRRAPRAR